MESRNIARSAMLIIVVLAGCSTWHKMDKPEGTVAGGAGGAVAGAVVGGPVGAVVGGVGGAYVGNEVAGKEPAMSTSSSSSATSSRYESALVRSVQQALNDKGYNAGPVDGQWGPATEDAVRKFQRSSGLPETGQLEQSTLSALGVAARM